MSTTELADIRTHLEETLPETCTISYVTRTPDGSGGWTEAWTDRGTAIECRLSAARYGLSENITAERLQEGQAWQLSLHWDQAVAYDDKVTYNSNEYRVMQINDDEAEIMLKRVYVVRWE